MGNHASSKLFGQIYEQPVFGIRLFILSFNTFNADISVKMFLIKYEFLDFALATVNYL